MTSLDPSLFPCPSLGDEGRPKDEINPTDREGLVQLPQETS